MKAADGGAGGGHIPIGQKDSLLERPGRLFKSDVEQVEEAERAPARLAG